MAILVVVAMVVGPVPSASAQAPQEGPDYNFIYVPGYNPPLRLDWNIFSGATNIPYFVHVDVVAAGFLNAVQNAFDTYENDPGSNISFVYMGTTTVVSELQGANDNPTDNINVVSFGSPPNNAAGRGGLSGTFVLGPDGRPDGNGDGQFDLTISNSFTFSTGPDPGTTDLESLVLHELGHALGLQHPQANTDAVMYNVLDDGMAKRSLTSADRAGLAVMYPANAGEPCEGLAITIDMNTGASGVGTSGDDVILGTPGPDTIDAGAGNDVVCAQGGADTVVGGDGNDTIFGQGGGDLLRGGPGVDFIDGGAGDDRVLGGIGGDTLIGGDGSDYLGGFGGNDSIDAGPGNDTVFGGFGGDTINGGPGNDNMRGLIGDDNISGGTGNDELFGDRGNDTISGGSGNDLISGGNANDKLFGDAGDDSVNGGKADDQMSGGDGIDICTGNNHINGDTATTDCETIFGTP